MKKILGVLLVLSMFITTGAFAEVKIGVVNMQKALDESDAGKDAVAKMKKEYDQMQQEINKESEALKKMQEELNNQSSLLTEEAKQKKLDEYQKKLKEVQRLVKDANDELKKKEQDYVAKIARELAELVEKLGKELNYDLIVEAKESGVMYNSKKIDITDILIDRYNKEWHKK
ncbi:OmpH family outer membrane protein [Deferribacteraceae bacterium V6Fe1]|nr:OmpH family outer membrane protein [Deferribacteraceae bacterium V6Fe1]